MSKDRFPVPQMTTTSAATSDVGQGMLLAGGGRILWERRDVGGKDGVWGGRGHKKGYCL